MTNQHEAGATLAGKKVGGQFAETVKSRPDGSILRIQSSGYDAEVNASLDRKAKLLRGELRSHLRARTPEAAYVVVEQCNHDGEYGYEVLGVLDANKQILNQDEDPAAARVLNEDSTGDGTFVFDEPDPGLRTAFNYPSSTEWSGEVTLRTFELDYGPERLGSSSVPVPDASRSGATEGA